MTDPISVLLIIGAAVIGPIEAQPVNQPCGGHYLLPGAPPNPPPCQRETLPELCARAKREIGLVYNGPETSFAVGTVNYIGWWIRNPPQFLGPEIPVGKSPAICIPTPSGYRGGQAR